ncbi:hypothetical protein [Streptomyces sp. NPDC058953]|uniref:hypothetical protein n=1 Tax=unclassified Streptomyces TaxID=2593676 RepID=UPI0036AD2235
MWTPPPAPAYFRNLAAYATVIGLITSIALAPALQRRPWLFPMPATRADCPSLGTYESLRTKAALATEASRDPSALSFAQQTASHQAVADCLSRTTTRWLPVYALGVALLVAVTLWSFDRARGATAPVRR